MKDDTPMVPRLGELGLTHFAPYLMNRIMGRYNASLREEMADQGLTTPKMRALAVLSVVEAAYPRIGGLYRGRSVNAQPLFGSTLCRRFGTARGGYGGQPCGARLYHRGWPRRF